MSRELSHYSPISVITDTSIVARSSWFVYQMTTAVISLKFPSWSQEDVADELLRLFSFYNDVDCRAGLPLCTPERLYGMPYHPLRVQPKLYSKADGAVSRWLEQSSLSEFPRLPQSQYLTKISTTKLLRQGYFAGNYPRLQSALRLFDDEARISITFKVPQSVAIQFRLMALMARATTDHFAACIIMYAWERLGRSILHGAGGAKDLTAAFNYYIDHPSAQ